MSSILHSRRLRLRHVQLPYQEVLTWPIGHLFHHGSLLPWIISSLQGRSGFGGWVQRPHTWAGFLQDLDQPWKTSTGHFNPWSDIYYNQRMTQHPILCMVEGQYLCGCLIHADNGENLTHCIKVGPLDQFIKTNLKMYGWFQFQSSIRFLWLL